jgi:hypothetical protein
MLLQTGLINQLLEQGKTIAIIAPDIQDANLVALNSHPQVSLYEATADTNIWSDDYLFKRKYFLEDIKSNPALWEKHIQATRYNTSKHPWRLIRPFLYGGIYRLNKVFPSIGQRFAARESENLRSAEMSDLIEKINPKLVISTYPVAFLEAKVLYAAKQKNIRTCIHLLSWDNITSKGKFPVSADYYIVWGQIMREELQEYYGTSKERIYTCGVPHFDNHIRVKNAPNYEELLVELGLNPGLPYIFVAMSSPYFAPGEIDIVERLAEEVKDNVFGEKMQLIVRPHPQNVSGFLADKSWLPRLKKLKDTRIAVDFPQLNKSKLRWSMQQRDMDKLSNLLVGCTVCLNSGSTVSIDALMVGKPSILTSFDGDKKLSYWKSARRLIDYTHLRKFIDIGGAVPVFSQEDLRDKIKAYTQNANLDAEKRNQALQAQCFSDDGRSTERVVETVLEISAFSEEASK